MSHKHHNKRTRKQPDTRVDFDIKLKTNNDKTLASLMFEQQPGLSKHFARVLNIQILRCDSVKISCKASATDRSKAKDAFYKLAHQVGQGAFVSKDLINVVAGKDASLTADNSAATDTFNKKAANQNRRVQEAPHAGRHHQFVPKNESQAQLSELIENYDLVFAMGPAGTGKTHVAIAKAVQALRAGKVKKILLARPARESGEKIGFLPGDSNDKLAPYMRPLYDEMEKTFGKNYKNLFKDGTVEIVPVGFMRGRTFENAFIVMDEAQNTTVEQIKMALTRIGEGSKMVVSGDPHQIDLEDKSDSGIVFASERLKNNPAVAQLTFKHSEIVRSAIVSAITDDLTKDDKKLPKPNIGNKPKPLKSIGFYEKG